MEQPSLAEIFNKINAESFDAFLDPPQLLWNSRLRASAGRFIPGSRKFLRARPPTIEIASYLLEEVQALDLIRDTVAHEMIHYWLWVRRRPYGHTPEFYARMRLMGVSRYNTVPRNRRYKYIYRCLACAKEFPARKRLGVLACADCCRQHTEGKFDRRFLLELSTTIAMAVFFAVVSSLPAPAFAFGGKAAPSSAAPESAQLESSGETVWVTRPDGAQQCAPGSGQSLGHSAEELSKARIHVLNSQKGNDNRLHAQMCGIPSGRTNMFLIPKGELPKAIVLGFHQVK